MSGWFNRKNIAENSQMIQRNSSKEWINFIFDKIVMDNHGLEEGNPSWIKIRPTMIKEAMWVWWILKSINLHHSESLHWLQAIAYKSHKNQGYLLVFKTFDEFVRLTDKNTSQGWCTAKKFRLNLNVTSHSSQIKLTNYFTTSGTVKSWKVLLEFEVTFKCNLSEFLQMTDQLFLPRWAGLYPRNLF